ncbi:MAG TPA: hypothetical protein VJ872_17810 [Nocardioides sp.]|nr:hypothetical protein [Nocardioides sp.]
MIGSELALAKTFLDLLVARDVYEAPDAVLDVAAVLVDVDDTEAPFVASAFATALRAVSSDVPRWRAAAEAAVQLDLYESVGTLLDGLPQLPDPHQLGTAAMLLANPAISDEEREQGKSLLTGRTSTQTLRRFLEIRLGDARPESREEQMLDAQVWPGRHHVSELGRFAPVVYVAESGAPPAAMWRVIGALAQSGARVRRLGADVKRLPFQHWASEPSPLIYWSGTALMQWKSITRFDAPKAVLAAGEFDSALSLPRLVNEVRSKLPAGWAMKPAGRSESFEEQPSVFSVETLSEGGFDNLEMIYLGAAGRSVLQSMAKDFLTPREADRQRWTFDQLVTLRLVQGFKAFKRTRIDAKRVYERLNDIALASASSAVAFDAAGELYINQGGGFRTLESDQEAMEEVLQVDVAFRPFKLGGGQVPDLLNPSARTLVDPRILGGTPVIRGRRLSARSINHVFTLRGAEATRSAFPELDSTSISDAVSVARQIDKNRAVSR